MTLKQSDGAVIAALVLELSTELDLHYGDAELRSCAPAIDALYGGAKLLQANGFTVPEAQKHIMNRYLAAASGGKH